MSVQAQAQIQETQKLAPNNIPVPWYSQKIAGCPYSHCSLASSLMVFDYFKGMTADTQRTAQDAEKKLIEYQRNYFLLEMFGTYHVFIITCQRINLKRIISSLPY